MRKERIAWELKYIFLKGGEGRRGIMGDGGGGGGGGRGMMGEGGGGRRGRGG